jgi:hypothetical protein
MIAHAILAILLASAMAATFVGSQKKSSRGLSADGGTGSEVAESVV